MREFDVFLSHNHNDSARVEALARRLMEKHGLRVWLDKWECVAGKLEPQCETGIRNSRYTIVAGSEDALRSKWVRWEIDKHGELNPEGRLIPVKLELDFPPDLDEVLWGMRPIPEPGPLPRRGRVRRRPRSQPGHRRGSGLAGP